jgi:hypothetical protein
MIIHTKDYKFECEICGKKFTQKDALRRHLSAKQNGRAGTCTRELNSILFKSEFETEYDSKLILNGLNEAKMPNTSLRKLKGQTWRKKPHQREKLEAYFFKVRRNPDKDEIEIIAEELGITTKVAFIWFMNQRAKGKILDFF